MGCGDQWEGGPDSWEETSGIGDSSVLQSDRFVSQCSSRSSGWATDYDWSSGEGEMIGLRSEPVSECYRKYGVNQVTRQPL